MGGLLSCVWVNERELNGEYVGILTIVLTTLSHSSVSNLVGSYGPYCSV